MGIAEEPSWIYGKNGKEVNPIFGTINIVKNSEMPTVHNFNHEHFWEIDLQHEDGKTDIICECGKGKTLDKNLTAVNGKIVQL